LFNHSRFQLFTFYFYVYADAFVRRRELFSQRLMQLTQIVLLGGDVRRVFACSSGDGFPSAIDHVHAKEARQKT
jgi:hypothetical protein